MGEYLARVERWRESSNSFFGIRSNGITAGEHVYHKEDGICGAVYIGQVPNLIETITSRGLYNPKGSDNLTNINEVFEGKPFNYVSLFSGIGGFEQALNNLGGTCVMASEIDKYANQSYEILYGHPTVGDVTKVAAEDVPDHDLLVGGFPCQAFSVAGKRLGFDDTRGTLFFEIARIAKVKRPKAMLLENVKGLISHDKGNTLDAIVQTLDEIGYTVDFEVMNSKYFGVPQNRERIFICAVRNDLVETAEWEVGKRSDVVAKGKRRIAELGVKTFNFDWPAQEEVTVRLRDILESDVDEKFYLSEEKTEMLVKKLEATTGESIEKEDDGNVLQRSMSGVHKKELYGTLRAGASRTEFGVIEPQMLGHIDLKGHDAIKRVYSAEGVSPTLTTMGGGHREPKIAVQMNRNEIGKKTEISHCLMARDYKGFGNQDMTGVIEGDGNPQKYRIRKVTPRECFRLQGFPDAEFDKLTANGLSNSQLYKQAGNAVTVNVISALGRRLLPLIKEAE